MPLSFIDIPERTYVDGLIGTYALNRVELLRDVLAWAHERSVRRYKTVRDLATAARSISVQVSG